jgi:aspartate kinase
MVIVCKFGGTSVGSAQAMREAAAIVAEALPQAPLVVLSAMSATTDGLFRAARLAERGELAQARAELESIFERHRAAAVELLTDGLPAVNEELARHRDELEVLLHGVSLLRELTRRTLDAIVSHGELLSSVLFIRLLERRGIAGQWFDVRRVMRTDAQFGSAVPQRSAIAELCRVHLLPLLTPGRTVVTQGYLGATEQGHATTLGRGGSDYSATLLGAAVAASEVQIWTDVEGVLTADPRVVPDARPIATLTFAEAAEMAAFGAKVLHPATIQPAVEADIPVTVRHTGRPRGPRMFDQSGYLARVFEVFGRLGVSVDLVVTAEVSVSCTVDADAPVDKLMKELAPFATVEATRDRALVSVIGERIKSAPFAVRDTFAALGEIVPELISLGGNEINLSFVVPYAQARNAVRALHRAFFQPVEAPSAESLGTQGS